MISGIGQSLPILMWQLLQSTTTGCLDAETSDIAWPAQCRVNHHKVPLATTSHSKLIHTTLVITLHHERKKQRQRATH